MMAKKGIIVQNKMRHEYFKKYMSYRNEIKAQIKKLRKEQQFNEIYKLQRKLDMIPRNATISRLRNRCMITGRCRGLVCYSRFGLCSFQLRQYINNGYIVGTYKR